MKVAVIGGGIIGLTTTLSLDHADHDVTCFERAGTVMTERSSGDSRIFRVAHADAELVELAVKSRRRYELWSQQAAQPLIRPVGCVISGDNVPVWAAAMTEANQQYDITETQDKFTLPTTKPLGQALYDPGGGVIETNAVCTFLNSTMGSHVTHEHVYAIEPKYQGVRLWSSGGKYLFDRVIIAAGAGTSALAAQANIFTPTRLAHHIRFTFRLSSPARFSSWIDKPGSGLATYQHQAGPESWSVGGHLNKSATAWEVGRAAAFAKSMEAVVQHVEQNLELPSDVTDSLYCTVNPDLGDGFEILHCGDVSAVYGENLFKLAPVIGELLASSV